MLILICCSQTEIPSEYVKIPDDQLAGFIRRALDLEESDPIPVSRMKELTELELGWSEPDIYDLKGLEKATNLTELIIENPHSISDITPISKLTKLQTLKIYNNSISDLSPIAELSQLKQLTFLRGYVEDLSPLAGLTQLRRLFISDNLISDLAPLSGLIHLNTLYFYNNPLSDISPLVNLQELESLEFHEPIPDISPLSALTKLKSLKFLVPPPEIESLATMVSLNTLEFYDSNITDISPLEGLTELRELKLYQNKIEDITPLNGMIKLEKLELYKNNITDISPLAGMTELTELRLDGNNINDISPLSNLTKLSVLGLEHNKIQDISPIERLHALTVLYLKHNPVEDTSPIQKLFANNENLNSPETLYPKHKPSSHPRVFHEHETRSELPEGAIARLGKGGINVIRFSPDGKFLAVGSDVGIYLYSAKTGEEIALPNKTIGQVNAIAFSSDSNILAMGGYLRPTIQLWNLKTRTELPPFSTPLTQRINQSISIQSAIALAFGVNDTVLVCVSHLCSGRRPHALAWGGMPAPLWVCKVFAQKIQEHIHLLRAFRDPACSTFC